MVTSQEVRDRNSWPYSLLNFIFIILHLVRQVTNFSDKDEQDSVLLHAYSTQIFKSHNQAQYHHSIEKALKLYYMIFQ